jgi:hypothetical protein
MARYGYFLASEENDPWELLRPARLAEEAGQKRCSAAASCREEPRMGFSARASTDLGSYGGAESADGLERRRDASGVTRRGAAPAGQAVRDRFFCLGTERS